MIPKIIGIMQRYVGTLMPLLPWAQVRKSAGVAAATDCDDLFDTEPRISHFCVQVLANLACDDIVESADAIPGFTVCMCVMADALHDTLTVCAPLLTRVVCL